MRVWPNQRQDPPRPPAGPSSPTPFPEVSTWVADPRFREAQQTDLTLWGLQALVAVREGQIEDSRGAERLPRIVQEGGLWFRLLQGKDEIQKQVLVLEPFQDQLL